MYIAHDITTMGLYSILSHSLLITAKLQEQQIQLPDMLSEKEY